MTEISKNCRLQAHRGVSTDAPENTLAAFRESVKQGYDLIELDPKYTKDGIIILLHDKTLNKTGRIAGKAFDSPISVSELNFSELSEVEAGSWFSPEFTGEAIPTLAAVLDFGKAFDMEIKIDNCIQSFPSEMLEALKNVVKKHAKPEKAGFTFSNLGMLSEFAEEFPLARLHYDGVVTDESIDYLKKLGISDRTTVWMRFDNKLSAWSKVPPVDEISAKKIKRDFSLGLWILNSEDEMEEALRFAPDIVETTGGVKPR